jgi:RecB family endonuclease NucS
MRIMAVDCEVSFTGRIYTQLPRAVRALLIKADGTVMVQDEQGYKPINWMIQPTEVETPRIRRTKVTDKNGISKTPPTTWVFASKKERLEIKIFGVLDDHHFELDLVDKDLSKEGTELDLQAWVAANPTRIDPHSMFTAREHPTGAGPVDVLLTDVHNGAPIAVECKRTTSLQAVSQLGRYVSELREEDPRARGILVAYDVRPRTRTLCEKHGFGWVEVPMDEVISDLKNGSE